MATGKGRIRHIRVICSRIILPAALVLIALAPGYGDEHRWINPSGTSDWNIAGNWSGGVPHTGDDVYITFTNIGVLLTSTTPYLGSLTISNRSTLVFSNWDTTLRATNVVVATGATLTCSGPFTNNVMSNNVVIVCSNLTIASNGTISVDGKGFRGGPNYNGGCGPGAGQSAEVGGGHGGEGGLSYRGVRSPSLPFWGGGVVYGVSNAPLCPGSGGGGASGNGPGGDGGGAVRIQADGMVTVHGVISAGGVSGPADAGGGSGGSIFIMCKIFSGNGGLVGANGGVNNGGAGGRIAVIYDPALQSAQPIPSVVFSAAGGGGSYGYTYGDIGTLYFPDNRFLTPTIPHSGQWSVPGFTNWSVDTLAITNNGWIRFPADGFKLTITNQLVVYGTNDARLHRLELVNGSISCSNLTLNSGLLVLHRGSPSLYSVLNCAGDLILTNGSRFYVFSSMTNGAAPDYGALVNVAGNVFIHTNNWIYPYAHSSNGGSVFFQVKNLTVFPSAGFDADGKGYEGGPKNGLRASGPGGATSYHGGGGYGGSGGPTAGGVTYGSSNAPSMPGSGGGGATGNGPGGNGGGSVRIYATGTFTLNGIITAKGIYYCADSGGGSGGGIYIRCKILAGTSGSINANGEAVSTGGGGGGGGGGGRIAIWRQNDLSAGAIQASAAGGSGVGIGQPGTIVWGQLPAPGTIFSGR